MFAAVMGALLVLFYIDYLDRANKLHEVRVNTLKKYEKGFPLVDKHADVLAEEQ